MSTARKTKGELWWNDIVLKSHPELMRLFRAAKAVAEVYPYDENACLHERTNCKGCQAQTALVKALAAVGVKVKR